MRCGIVLGPPAEIELRQHEQLRAQPPRRGCRTGGRVADGRLGIGGTQPIVLSLLHQHTPPQIRVSAWLP